jgi:hypothetical protein
MMKSAGRKKGMLWGSGGIYEIVEIVELFWMEDWKQVSGYHGGHW